MTFQAEVNLEMTVRISNRDQVTGEDITKLNALFAAVEALGGVIKLPSDNSDGSASDDVIPIVEVSINPNTVIWKDSPDETKLQLVVTPSGANQAITVTDISDPSALQYLEYDAATRTITTRGEYANRDATILVEWEGGSKQFTIPVQLYSQPQSA